MTATYTDRQTDRRDRTHCHAAFAGVKKLHSKELYTVASIKFSFRMDDIYKPPTPPLLADASGSATGLQFLAQLAELFIKAGQYAVCLFM